MASKAQERIYDQLIVIIDAAEDKIETACNLYNNFFDSRITFRGTVDSTEKQWRPVADSMNSTINYFTAAITSPDFETRLKSYNGCKAMKVEFDCYDGLLTDAFNKASDARGTCAKVNKDYQQSEAHRMAMIEALTTLPLTEQQHQASHTILVHDKALEKRLQDLTQGIHQAHTTVFDILHSSATSPEPASPKARIIAFGRKKLALATAAHTAHHGTQSPTRLMHKIKLKR